MSERLSKALNEWWRKRESKQWIYGKLGKISPDGSYLFDVPGRSSFVYVTLRSFDGAQTTVAARNDAGVPQAPRLNVRMKLEYGVYVIYSKSARADLGTNPAPNPTGVETHDHDALYYEKSEFISSSTGVASAGLPIKTDSGGLLGGSLIDSQDIKDIVAALPSHTPLITADYLVSLNSASSNAPGKTLLTDLMTWVASYVHGLTSKSPPVDADELMLLDSAASFGLKRLTGLNLKAYLKTYFDTLYNLYVHPNHSGDVTSVGDGATTIAAHVVTFAKMQTITTSRLLGRTTAGTGDIEQITLGTFGATLINEGSAAATRGDLGLGNLATLDNVDTGHILADAVDNSKLANIVTDSLIGRDTAGTGDPETILLGASLSMDGSGNLQRAALSGDISASANSNTTAIGANKVLTAMINDAQVTLAKMANLAQSTIIGRAAGAGTGVPTALSVAQVVAIINATLDHGTLAGLTGSDDHTQYALLAGRSGGQVVSGGTATTDDLTLNSSSNASPTSGSVVFIQTGSASRTMIGSAVAPIALLHTHRTVNAGRSTYLITNDGTGNCQAGFRAGQDPTDDTANYIAMDVLGSAYSTSGSIEASATIVEGNSAGNMLISSFSNTKPMLFLTGNSRTERMRITAGGLIGLGGVTPASATVAVKAGTSTNDAAVGGTLFTSVTAVGNVGAGTDDLITYTVPANTLAVNGQSVWFEAWGSLANNANSKTVTLAWGADTFTLIAAAMDTSNTTWSVRGRIFRTGAATQLVLVNVTDTGDITGNQGDINSTGARTLSGSNVLKLTAVGVADNDIVCTAMIVGWDDNNS